VLDLPAAHQHLAVLGAAVQRGDHLAGVEQTLGSKARLTPNICSFSSAELHAHAVELFDAHAVLAGHGAAHGHAGFQDVGAKQLAAVQLVRVVRIEQDQRVQVAVARVEHVGAAQLVLLLHLLQWPAGCRPGACAGWSSPCTCSRG
jgi:hypothetical protein